MFRDLSQDLMIFQPGQHYFKETESINEYMCRASIFCYEYCEKLVAYIEKHIFNSIANEVAMQRLKSMKTCLRTIMIVMNKKYGF